MLDIGWSELLLIGIVALIVIGPRDLPHLFHSLGRFTAKARGMAREFTSAMEDAAKSSGLDEATGSLRDMKALTSKKSLGLDALDRAADRFEKWDPKLPNRPSGKAVPDPGAKEALAADAGATPKAAVTAAAATAAKSAAPKTAAAPEKPNKPDDQAESVAAAPGTRRIHAVRRADMKED
ncbi:Sec-independent protein translocase protein TatB (plasmid) [Paracoccus sp. TK19116]|uniref:Sec-independent protein translocase protein TatB n=1 Tax=Paracoccus albicereus TaxID=2922394 RepID=A0ABT1MKP4_9RHOB|nr:Sec-independent protein translocase protein TatB [Paracoccus albicereus]MCQ0968873.1 Sec-independent protein translocase protein TatB [Paracoccus albicereus]